jgi:catechol 2,3-dioxygenase-like lactoylglutathione lyase family enzyme
MPQSTLSLLALRARDLDRALRFYRGLGLTFVQDPDGRAIELRQREP